MIWKAATIHVLAIASVLASASALQAQAVKPQDPTCGSTSRHRKPNSRSPRNSLARAIPCPTLLVSHPNRTLILMPGSPAAQKSAPPGAGEETKQTKRILYIVPNFRAVTANQKLPPQSVKEKFLTATMDSVDYSSFIFVGVQAGIQQATNATPEFRQGAAGYGRYYWHTFADTLDENLWVEFIYPTVLRQDSRYYTLGHGGFPKRLAYSFSRIAITRADSGHETFNASEIFGAGTAAGISYLVLSQRGAHLHQGLPTVVYQSGHRWRHVCVQGVLARHQ